jgi:hypothetical protein
MALNEMYVDRFAGYLLDQQGSIPEGTGLRGSAHRVAAQIDRKFSIICKVRVRLLMWGWFQRQQTVLSRLTYNESA